jgi:hypothetical protein
MKPEQTFDIMGIRLPYLGSARIVQPSRSPTQMSEPARTMRAGQTVSARDKRNHEAHEEPSAAKPQPK